MHNTRVVLSFALAALFAGCADPPASAPLTSSSRLASDDSRTDTAAAPAKGPAAPAASAAPAKKEAAKPCQEEFSLGGDLDIDDKEQANSGAFDLLGALKINWKGCPDSDDEDDDYGHGSTKKPKQDDWSGSGHESEPQSDHDDLG